MLQTRMFRVVIPPGVLTFHPYAKLLPPWKAAAIVSMESSELPRSWASTLVLSAWIVLPSCPCLGQLLRAQCELEPL